MAMLSCSAKRTRYCWLGSAGPSDSTENWGVGLVSCLSVGGSMMLTIQGRPVG